MAREKGKDIKKKCTRKGCKNTIIIPSRFASTAAKRKYCSTACSAKANKTTLTEAERFKAKLSKNKKGCLLWMGGTNSAKPPVGLFRISESKSVPAHRYAYELFCGKIPKGEIVYQTCGNSLCCNKKHLMVMTRSEMLKKVLPRGGNHWKSKLTEKKVKAIRKDAAAGKSRKALAKKYDVSEGQISLIVSRASWAWVK